jgi:hypothetical protein
VCVKLLTFFFSLDDGFDSLLEKVERKNEIEDLHDLDDIGLMLLIGSSSIVGLI